MCRPVFHIITEDSVASIIQLDKTSDLIQKTQVTHLIGDKFQQLACTAINMFAGKKSCAMFMMLDTPRV
jgi:hypothetical protein